MADSDDVLHIQVRFTVLSSDWVLVIDAPVDQLDAETLRGNAELRFVIVQVRVGS